MNRQQRRQAARSSKSGPEAADPLMAAAKQAHEAGRHAEAEATYNRLLVENPKNPDALHYKGLLFYQYGRAGEAVALLREAIALRRGVPTFHGNLANVLLHLGDMDGAEAEFRKALRLDKKYVKAYINFSVLLMGRGRLPEAEEMARRALRLQPENAEAYNCLGSILRQQGQRLDAEAAFRRALEINPDYEEAHGNLIFLQDFDPALSFKELQDARRRWAERFMDPLLAGAQPHANSPDPDRKLRIGYVSGDFRNHSAASAFTAVVLERDRENFEAYCYMTSARRDEATARFEAAADGWRPCWGLPDAELAAQIRADEIDILVDLSGHSAGNRLAVFARKPAPVQITAWGHCTGTGMKAMDYFFADPVIVPPEDARHCAEEVIPLSCVLGITPPGVAPDVVGPPVLRNGYATFGCFNRTERLGEETLGAWSRILERCPDARLLLKSAELDNREIAKRVEKKLGAHGIDLSRVELRGRTPWFDHLAAYGDVDVALDPFPNNGGVTTLETLWMGVPVVALDGATITSRLAASIVSASGHAEWVGGSVADYIEIAERLGKEATVLKEIRAGLRGDLNARPLGNGKLYAQEIEGHYRRVWHNWCARS